MTIFRNSFNLHTLARSGLAVYYSFLYWLQTSAQRHWLKPPLVTLIPDQRTQPNPRENYRDVDFSAGLRSVWRDFTVVLNSTEYPRDGVVTSGFKEKSNAVSNLIEKKKKRYFAMKVTCSPRWQQSQWRICLRSLHHGHFVWPTIWYFIDQVILKFEYLN